MPSKGHDFKIKKFWTLNVKSNIRSKDYKTTRNPAKRGERGILREAREEGRRLYFSPPLVSRLALVSRFAQNVAFASLGS